MDKKENVISILVNNKPDVLARVAGTLGGKGYNIETLCVDVTINPDVSKIILTTIGTKATVQKIEAQLARLIDVIKVENLTDVETVKRELVLIRMSLTADSKSELIRTDQQAQLQDPDIQLRSLRPGVPGDERRGRQGPGDPEASRDRRHRPHGHRRTGTQELKICG